MITPASVEYHKAQCSTRQGLEQSLLQHRPRTERQPSGCGRPQADGTVLSEQQKAMCSQFGMEEKVFAKTQAALQNERNAT